MMADIPRPKAFISYSWTSGEHKDRVRMLVDRLLGDGVEVLLDQYDLREGDDTYAYMERMVTDPKVTKVLIICNRAYKEKADQRKGGVGHESTIISPEVYKQVSSENNKFVAVIFEKNESGPYIPAMFASKLYIEMSTPETFEANYEQLLRFLYNKPLLKKPKVGSTPSFLLEDTRPTTSTSGKVASLREAINRDRLHMARGLLSDYLDVLKSVLEKMPPALSNGNLDDEIAVREIQGFKVYRNEFAELLRFIGRFANPTQLQLVDQIGQFFEDVARLQERLGYEQKLIEEAFNHVAYLVQELFIYVIAVLHKDHMINEATALLERGYFVKSWRNDTARYRTYGVFRVYLKILEENRKARLKESYYSMQANLMSELSDSGIVSWAELCQTDCILWLRLTLNDPVYGDDTWYPTTVPYWSTVGGFPTFMKAESKQVLNQLLQLIGTPGLEDTKTKIQVMMENHQSTLRKWSFEHYLRIQEQLNLEKLGTQP